MVGIAGGLIGLGSLVFSPIMDFVKKKFLKPSEDSVEATLSTLATTKPEVMPLYIDASSKLLQAKINFFNRDVIGIPSKWVIDLRAAIRPAFVVISLAYLFVSKYYNWPIDPWFACLMEVTIGSWFGSRLVK